MKHYTRFRAFQLGTEGSSFSLRVDDHFTLIEAKLTKTNVSSLCEELKLAQRSDIDVLHITSWDRDHCDDSSLEIILKYFKPKRIEYPPYMPEYETGRKCLNLIEDNYTGENEKISTIRAYNSEHNAREYIGQDFFLNPIRISENHNDNSIVKFFRVGSFQILSLGDCESDDISSRLQDNEIIQNEVDVLILAHHGSENSICTKEFLEKVYPRVAICSSNFDNKFEHPHQTVRNNLHSLKIPLFTTKTGDVIIESIDKLSFKVYNYCANNEECKNIIKRNNKTYYIQD